MWKLFPTLVFLLLPEDALALSVIRKKKNILIFDPTLLYSRNGSKCFQRRSVILRGGALSGWSESDSDNETEESFDEYSEEFSADSSKSNTAATKKTRTKKFVEKILNLTTMVILSLCFMFVVFQIVQKCDLRSLLSILAFIAYSLNIFQKVGGNSGYPNTSIFDFSFSSRSLGRRHFSFESINHEYSQDKEALNQLNRKIDQLSNNKKFGDAVIRHNPFIRFIFDRTESNASSASEKKQEKPLDDDTLCADSKLDDPVISKEPDDTVVFNRKSQRSTDVAVSENWISKLLKAVPLSVRAEHFESQDKENGSAATDSNITASDSAFPTVQQNFSSNVEAVERIENVYIFDLSTEEVMAELGSYISDIVTFILDVVKIKSDEVIVRLTSPGGGVGEYGLAAAQLERLRSAGVKLTICIDTVAASGGYLMATVASHLVASSFALIGSIGVIGSTLNVYKAMKKFGIENYMLTAGKYKAPIGLTNEVSRESLEKCQMMIDDIQEAFKAHVVKYRPFVKIEEVSTGEVWIGTNAKELGLIDEVSTSSDYIRRRVLSQAKVFRIKKYTHPQFGVGSLRKAFISPFSHFSSFIRRCDRLLQIAESLLSKFGISEEREDITEVAKVKLGDVSFVSVDKIK